MADMIGKSTVKFVFGIDNVNRKWALRSEKASKDGGKKQYFGSYESNRPNKYGIRPVHVLFVRKNYRTTPYSAEEIAAKALFAARVTWIIARKQDLTKIAQDQAAFLAQRDTAGGVKSLNAYYWVLAKENVTEA